MILTASDLGNKSDPLDISGIYAGLIDNYSVSRDEKVEEQHHETAEYLKATYFYESLVSIWT